MEVLFVTDWVLEMLGQLAVDFGVLVCVVLFELFVVLLEGLEVSVEDFLAFLFEAELLDYLLNGKSQIALCSNLVHIYWILLFLYQFEFFFPIYFSYFL